MQLSCLGHGRCAINDKYNMLDVSSQSRQEDRRVINRVGFQYGREGRFVRVYDN